MPESGQKQDCGMDLKRWLLALLVVLGLSCPIAVAPAQAALPPGNAVKDPTAIQIGRAHV